MKKFLLTIASACLLGSLAFAQSPVTLQEKQLIKAENKVTKTSNKTTLGKAGTFTEEWYSVENLFTASPVGPGLQNFVAFLMHDTVAKRYNSDNTISNGYYVGVGHIFDPKDDLIQLSTTQPAPTNYLSKFNSYWIDSIALNYLYVRQVDSTNNGNGMIGVTDTVFIAYYAGAQIQQSKFTDNNISYAALDSKWDFGKRMPSGYLKMDTFLLSTGANGTFDTTRVSNSNGGFENGWQSKVATWAAPAGMKITANSNGTTTANLTGYLLVFKSGVRPIVNGDTAIYNYELDPSTFPAGARRTNYFGYGYQRSTTKYTNYLGRNTSQLVTGSSSYAAQNGWEGAIATSAFLNTELYLNTFFHLQVDPAGVPAGVNEANGVSIKGVYPNPAKTTATINFNVNNAGKNTRIEVLNVVGQVVKTIALEDVAAGSYEYVLGVTDMKAGIYFVSVTSGNSTQTQKLVIAD